MVVIVLADMNQRENWVLLSLQQERYVVLCRGECIVMRSTSLPCRVVPIVLFMLLFGVEVGNPKQRRITCMKAHY